jgi:hypothetical protein
VNTERAFAVSALRTDTALLSMPNEEAVGSDSELLIADCEFCDRAGG